MRIGSCAMRKWAPLLLLAGSAWPAMAAKSVTVGQVDQLLFALRGKSDAKVAQELSDVELTERVSPARLAHWEADFPGSRTHEALIKLADLAAFLNPPAADVLPIPAPDSETQDRMLALAAEYVKTTVTRIPNFVATRETTHFEDTPSRPGAFAIVPNRVKGPMAAGEVNRTDAKALRQTGSYPATVAYRDGKEVPESAGATHGKDEPPPVGLTTSGEFGPILSVAIGDAVRSEVTWQRWEQGASDPVAVFRYAVPAEQSNYMLEIPTDNKLERVYPGYHGEIAIDPATGAILRISMVTEPASPSEAMQAAISVEYAPVAIGGQSYICPVHGVAFSRLPLSHGSAVQPGSTVGLQTQLNDVIFSQYHVFRSETRIANDASGTGAAAPAAANSTRTVPADHQP